MRRRGGGARLSESTICECGVDPAALAFSRLHRANISSLTESLMALRSAGDTPSIPRAGVSGCTASRNCLAFFADFFESTFGLVLFLGRLLWSSFCGPAEVPSHMATELSMELFSPSGRNVSGRSLAIAPESESLSCTYGNTGRGEHQRAEHSCVLRAVLGQVPESGTLSRAFGNERARLGG